MQIFLFIFVLISTAFASPAQPDPTLKELAQKKNIYIGVFAEPNLMNKDPRYEAILNEEFDLMSVGVFFSVTRPQEKVFNFVEADSLMVDFP